MRHIIILIDTSYSMENYKNNVINGLNNFINKIKNNYNFSNDFLTVCQFNTNMTYLLKTRPVASLNDIIFNTSMLKIDGATALYDSIGTIINDFINTPYETHLFIISDGDDNSSNTYNKIKIEDKCKFVQNNNWIITHCTTENIHIENSILLKYNIDDISDILSNLRL